MPPTCSPTHILGVASSGTIGPSQAETRMGVGVGRTEPGTPRDGKCSPCSAFSSELLRASSCPLAAPGLPLQAGGAWLGSSFYPDGVRRSDPAPEQLLMVPSGAGLVQSLLLPLPLGPWGESALLLSPARLPPDCEHPEAVTACPSTAPST